MHVVSNTFFPSGLPAAMLGAGAAGACEAAACLGTAVGVAAGARAIGHEYYCALDFFVGETGIATFGRHGVLAFDRTCVKGFDPRLDPWLPGCVIAHLGCPSETDFVACLAHRL